MRPKNSPAFIYFDDNFGGYDAFHGYALWGSVTLIFAARMQPNEAA